MSEIEERVRKVLAELGPPFELIDCDPDFADTAAFCERYGYRPEESANTIVVASKREPKQFVACVVLATTRLDVNGTVKRRLDAGKVSFASAEETAELTGMIMGGVTVLALPAEVPIWVDSRVMRQDRIIVGGGSRALKVGLSPEALARLVGVEIVEDLAKEVT